ncbi:MAG: hypothetical protein KBC66_10800 [Kiritimatiellae bacterium]|jgi:uncharacterized alkaline shock family protein YloU|nr:hypothetical protein [Kiritimatiellia bacterium]NLD90230.1 hypothetical protein [Lentisphaerota bacterium]HPC18871.1 hypothetical protein [Kiritimatiellia bacterium]HQN81041.1 hypothetical protein [Kiritimatiellia bacterium]HQQ59847.1 hypothetical protein [Kiritimatiellia bacterium]
MKAIHFLLGLVLFLSLAAAGLALVISPQVPEVLRTAVAWGAAQPDWVKVAVGIGGLVFLFAYLLTGFPWRRAAFITFENENGTVSVNTEAVQRYLDTLKNEFAAVVWQKSHLRVVRGALDVGLVLGVRDGTQIPELCKLMQARVRELLEEHLGTCDLHGVSVEVNEIRSRKPAPAGTAT